MKRTADKVSDGSTLSQFTKQRGISVSATARVKNESKAKTSWQMTKQKSVFLKMSVDASLPLITGGAHKWSFCSIAKLVQRYADSSAAYKDALLEAMEEYNQKLTLIIYEDEIVPGNVLMQKRKVHCWYFTFKELGLRLRSEYYWIPFAALFSQSAQKVSGGVSCVTKVIMQTLLVEVPNIKTGFAACAAQPKLLQVTFGPLLNDEVAMKFMWSVKGHAGLKPCLHCSNVLMKDHPLLASDMSLCDICEADVSKFVPATDEEIWNTQDHLLEQSLVLTKSRMETLAKCCGQNCEPLGLLACRELRADIRPSESLWDPMHCYFSDGVCDQEVDLLVKSLRSIGLTHDRLMEFCNQGWFTHNGRVKLVFKKDGLKGGASDVLTATPLLRHYIFKHVSPDALPAEQKRSFELLANVVMCLSGLKARPPNSLPRESIGHLKQLQQHHLQCFKAAYGNASVRPKHHYCLHIPSQLERNQFVIDCFTPERKRRLMIAELNAAYVLNPQAASANEIHLIATANVVQMSEMPDFEFGQRGNLQLMPAAAFGHQEDVCVSTSIRLKSGLELHQNEVFFYEDKAFVMRGCGALSTGLHVLVNECAFKRYEVHKEALVWSILDEIKLLPAEVPFYFRMVSRYLYIYIHEVAYISITHWRLCCGLIFQLLGVSLL
jgi:hypothetical protein